MAHPLLRSVTIVGVVLLASILAMAIVGVFSAPDIEPASEPPKRPADTNPFSNPTTPR
jgi:hypothetical protein